ncbi:ABC transporter substrate-binding protein [Halorubrum sp. JWXQ-INN 858]|uniref:PGF-CTERM-anchored ABC transporter substrate-binding protein n=1 Tax=Halorubrum sp. JWXQ-INN 858 TaxID=2690782 RepID=UPI00135A77F7|nr:PGF-CTERM-anchored ABC transporter substrate-binding protein [Halorubrum sp. JWXQ-INN 858]MWV65174.1 ABC transporter substrate-binding protein [Halorubrum sp. JWXQ-INN 858]
MRTNPTAALLAALLVTTALVGGAAGVAAGGTITGNTAVGSTTAGEATTDRYDATDGGDGDEYEASAGVATCEFPLTVTDATGEEIVVEGPPERITTTNPSAAQILWEIGARDRVVGVTQYAGYLDGAGEKENVSASFGVDVEKIVGTDPDLVLAPNASAEAVEPLRDAGVTVYHFREATDVDDIADKTATVGALVGECEAAADTNAWMYEEVDAVTEQTADRDRPGALYPLGSGFVAGGGTFIDEIMTIGGVDNVAAEHEGYPQLSPEVVLEADPELILVIDRHPGILDEEPYASTTAGIEGNAVEMEVHYLNQPAPRSVVESTATLADAVESYDDARANADGTDDGADDAASGADDAGDAGDAGDAEDTDTPASADDDGGTTGSEAPGFGAAVGAVAVLIASLAAVRAGRRR